ncbi:MAG: hypothetical protein ACXV8U_22555, partial [Methylobacter sp.]
MLGFIAFRPTYRTMAYRVVAGIRKSSESTDVEYDGHYVALLRFNNDRIAAAIAKVEIDAGMAGCSIETGTDSVQ